jgi:hypothetical protein
VAVATIKQIVRICVFISLFFQPRAFNDFGSAFGIAPVSFGDVIQLLPGVNLGKLKVQESSLTSEVSNPAQIRPRFPTGRHISQWEAATCHRTPKAGALADTTVEPGFAHTQACASLQLGYNITALQA